jgi:hypothetical protein
MMEIVDPPPITRGRGPTSRWTEIVKTLKTQHPGEYAKVGSYSSGVATQIRNGQYSAFIPDDIMLSASRIDYMQRHWDITTRKIGKATDIYIKWVGGNCNCRYCE